MKLNNIELTFDNFSVEMGKLKNEKHFDYLVTIIGEDFGEEGLGCIYILENVDNHERISTRCIAKRIGDDYVLPTTINLWKAADLLEREVFDFVGIKFLGHPDMRRLFLRSDFKGYPLRKDFDMSPENNQFPDDG
jgi:NADH-quinone oxidoreductase subunit C/D